MKKLLLLALQALPYVLTAVKAIETELPDAAGKTKKDVLMQVVTGAETAAGVMLPSDHAKVIDAVADGVVSVLNIAGVFSHKEKNAVPPVK